MDEEEEFKNICHRMSYGDDSQQTFDRYCELAKLNLTAEEKQKLKQETFE